MTTVLGISSYGSAPSVLEIVAEATSPQGTQLFDLILIVDSHGDGTIQRHIEREELGPRVRYHNSNENLGAAGNLDKRLRWATEAGGDLLFAINSDGHLDLATVEKLLDYASRHDCGAVYPARRLADNCYEFTGILSFPWRSVRRAKKDLPVAEAIPVFWSSSNGALYSLQPAANGTLPPAGLWHGWEDLAYGLLLAKAGHHQFMVPSARVESRYEMTKMRGLGAASGPYSYVSDKPTWIAYYTSRNLLLIATRVVPGPERVIAALTRISIEILVTLVTRDQKLERLGYLARGVFDGIRGRQGMVVQPPRLPIGN